MKLLTLLLSLFLLPTFLLSQNKEDLTASQILDSSLVFCGGEQRISKIESSRINYLLVQPDSTTAIVNDQLKTGKKNVQCILSNVHTPQTTFFNGKKISRVNGNSIVHITDIDSMEGARLKTFNQIQYGYKKLNYQLTRLPDQKFKNFDCFVINARASNGYTTMNFFDKTNFRLIMIVYPNGNKSLMIEYIFKDGILFNSKILNTFPNSQEFQTLELQTIELNINISDTWFNCPYTDKIYIPQHIKIGKFASTNGPATTFKRTEVSMDYIDEKENILLKRFIIWNIISQDTYGLIDEQEIKNKVKSSSSQIIVRIISWDKKGYVCQWVAGKYTDTQDYKIIK